MTKTTKIVIGLVVIILVIWAIVGASHTGKQEADTIKVGVIAPLTGTASSYGIDGKNSVVLALDEINANGGIGGKKVEYFIEDGKCLAPDAISAWNKLVSVNNV